MLPLVENDASMSLVLVEFCCNISLRNLSRSSQSTSCCLPSVKKHVLQHNFDDPLSAWYGNLLHAFVTQWTRSGCIAPVCCKWHSREWCLPSEVMHSSQQNLKPLACFLRRKQYCVWQHLSKKYSDPYWRLQLWTIQIPVWLRPPEFLQKWQQ